MAVAKPLPSQVTGQSKPGRRRSPYRAPPGRPPMHGASMLTRVLRTVPLDTIDGRSRAGVFLRRTRDELREQLGGEATPAQQLLVYEIARTALVARATGDYILRQDAGLVRDGALLPVVMQREVIVGNLTRMLVALGLRGTKALIPDLQDYIRVRDASTAAR